MAHALGVRGTLLHLLRQVRAASVLASVLASTLASTPASMLASMPASPWRDPLWLRTSVAPLLLAWACDFVWDSLTVASACPASFVSSLLSRLPQFLSRRACPCCLPISIPVRVPGSYVRADLFLKEASVTWYPQCLAKW